MFKFSKSILIFILVLMLGLVGCADLGSVEDEEEYYASFGDVSFVELSSSTSPDIQSFAMSKMYNSETIENFKCEMDEKYYKYIIIKCEKDATLDDFAMWFYSTETSTQVKFDVYLANSLVETYKADKDIDKFYGVYTCTYKHRVSGVIVEDKLSFDFNGYGQVTDEDNHKGTYTVDSVNENKVTFEMKYTEGSVEYWYLYTCTFDEQCTNVSVSKYDKKTSQEVYAANLNYVYQAGDEYSEAGLTNKIGSTSFYLEKKNWGSCIIEKWIYNSEEVKTIDIKEGQYLYFRVLNNCPGAFRQGISKLSFKGTNVMLRI